MSDNSRATAAAITGAVIGGIAGYLFFTERGRELLRQFEPALDACEQELNSFRRTVEKATGVAHQGRQLLNDAMGPGLQDTRYRITNQTSPF